MSENLAAVESVLDPSQPELVMWGTRYTKLAFEATLRQMFASNATPQRFRYGTDPRKGQIAIYRAGASRVESFPRIIVEVEEGTNPIEYVGDEEVADRYDDNGVFIEKVVAGNILLTVSLTIEVSKSRRDLDALFDLTQLFVRYLFRDKLGKMNIAYKTQRLGRSTEEDRTVGKVYGRVITIPCTVQFSQHLPAALFSTIDSIVVDFTAVEE